MRVREGARPVVLTWLLLAGLSSALLLRATFSSPPGTVFVGTFYYVDDFYNYLSYVQQAEEGALVFRNKLAPPTLPPALVNVEWLLVGWLAALLGGAPLIAYRLVGLAALAVLVHQVDRWLVRGGLPPPRRLPGLLLVFTGGGLGWVLVALKSGLRPYDVVAGVYPFVEALANPHFVVGTALLVAALGAFATDRPGLGAVLGNILALARPYDAALLAGVAALAVLVRWPPTRWPRRLLPLAALVPVLLYDAWVFLWSPGFRIFSAPVYSTSGPSLLELALAVGPAALIALTAARAGAGGPEGRHRLYLALWATLALLTVVLRPVSFSLQFLAGVGVPLLALGAIGLGRLRRGILEAAVVVFAGTAATVAALQLQPNSYRNVPAERWRVAAALGEVCRTGEIVVAPSDIGLYVGGLSSCWPWASHSASPEHASREAATGRFYSGTPPERSRFLDEVCATHVVVPRAWPAGGLPPGAPYRRGVEVDGPGGGLAVYSREPQASCRPASP
ncbi:MAG: hypothetical protein LJF30_03610 [Acidobacteria bacterium]|nr:hypothetical protein [Acidobacteriota bacterium]